MDCCLHYHSPKANRRRYRSCRVKFGVPLDQVCKRDIPGPLLVSNQTQNVIKLVGPSLKSRLLDTLINEHSRKNQVLLEKFFHGVLMVTCYPPSCGNQCPFDVLSVIQKAIWAPLQIF